MGVKIYSHSLAQPTGFNHRSEYGKNPSTSSVAPNFVKRVLAWLFKAKYECRSISEDLVSKKDFRSDEFFFRGAPQKK